VEDQNDQSVLSFKLAWVVSGIQQVIKKIVGKEPTEGTVMMTILKLTLPLRSQAPRNIVPSPEDFHGVEWGGKLITQQGKYR
jgi:hypothetical protein